MSATMELKTKEEKDAELDRRIEALRKKNQALVRRYQEIEEDKKKAEQEGIAVTTPRKPRPHDPELEKRRQEEQEKRRLEKENFTVTVDLSTPQEKRIVNDTGPQKAQEDTEGPKVQSPTKRMSGRVGRNQSGGIQQERGPREEVSGETPGRRGGRGGRRGRGGETPVGNDRRSKEWEEKRRQNIEKMNQEMEKIAEYERGQRQDGDKPSRHFLDDPRRSGPAPDTDRKEGSRRHVRNWGGLDFDNVKTGAEVEREWTSRRPGPKGFVDMTMSMTGRERAEYLRWKKEREQIDEERLARHRNATGQWRREWDAQKSDSMFTEDQSVGAEGTVTEQIARRDEGKRPPKDPTFGDFLSQGRSHGPRGERGRGRNRGSRPSYSMHDNRWEAEKEEDRKEKEDKLKQEAETEEVKSRTPEDQKAMSPQRDEPAEDDEDQWEDASDGEEEPEETELHPQSPKEQRTPRSKAHVLEPLTPQLSPEAAKPLSPFCPLDHKPVSDWGEEMELLSPRSSMGGESPPKPPSADASPQQNIDPEEPGRSKGQPGALSGGQPGALSGGQPGALSGGQPGALSGGQPGTLSGGQPGTLSGGQPGTQSGGQPGTQSGGQPGTQSGGQPGGQPEAQCGAESGGQPGGQPGAQSRAQSGAQAGEQLEGASGGQPRAQAGEQLEGASGGQPGAQAGEQLEGASGGQPGAQAGEQLEGASGGQPGAQAGEQLEGASGGHSVTHRGSDQADGGVGATQKDQAASAQD